jgi:glycosyltransferase involved in cell wall biosynthesis
MRIDENNEYILFLDEDDFDSYTITNENFSKKPLRAKVFSIEEQFQLVSRARKERLDLFHSPHFVVPLLWRRNLVTTIYDLIPLIYSESLPSTASRVYCYIMMRAAARKSRKVITDSYHTQRDIVKYLKIPETKVKVIYGGVNENYRPVENERTLRKVKERYKTSEKFIFYIGQWKPHKNILRLMRAFHKLKIKTGIPHKLVIGGRKDPRYSEIPALARDLELEEDIIFSGYIPEEDLPALYSAAELFVLPSLYEGFGLPLLEAMACGTPVVSSNASSLPEIARNAAIFVNPDSVEEIAQAIQEVLKDRKLREKLIQKGLKRARLFTWEKTGRETLRVYEEVYKGE